MTELALYLKQLKQVHKIQLEIALEVKRICHKYNIKYSLIAGTLLGAVRHEGFIPWDDDLDMGMLRADYERFIEKAKDELSDDYFLQTWETDQAFGLPFAKIRKNGTIFLEKSVSKTNQHSGIYLDIFPFDQVPTTPMAKQAHNIKTYILKRVLMSKLGYEVWDHDSRFKKATYQLVNLLFKPVSLEKTKDLLEKEMIQYNHQDSNHVVAIGGSYGYKKETIKKSWLGHLQTIEFEKEQFTVPVDHKKYLKNLYDDYMTLPPKNKRYNRHGIIEIDLGGDTN